MRTERRNERSSNPIEAAELYLKLAAERRSFTALALANIDGSLVAEAPTSLNSEALAAVAPFVRSEAESGDGLLGLVTRGDEFRVWDIDIAGEPHYLTAVGGDSFTPREAEATLRRILQN